ncbi:MAG: hypothetical protein IRZ13_06300 [Acetobacteraceae bacterium]|nr:hypothetical protein [Acetobacteraceae bacterium]
MKVLPGEDRSLIAVAAERPPPLDPGLALASTTASPAVPAMEVWPAPAGIRDRVALTEALPRRRRAAPAWL